MNLRGRPRRASIKIVVTLRLMPGEDDDLLDFFRNVPAGKKALAVKTGLRTSGIQTAHQMADLDDRQARQQASNFLEAF